MRRTAMFVCLAMTAACGGSGGDSTAPPATIPVSSVAVDPSSSTLFVGATSTLTAITKDAAGNALSGRPITWSSSNAAVVSVSASGVVSGVSAGGPVTVTATSEGRSGSAQLTVLAPVAAVEVTPAIGSLVSGTTLALTATLRDASGAVITGRTVTWNSSNSTLATVSTTGLVSGVAPGGPVTISASVEGRSANAQLTVLAPVASVAVTPTTLQTLVVGASLTATASALDGSNAPLTGRAIMWSSSNPAVATVTQGGLITAVAAGGPVTITATSEGKSGALQVTVIAPVASVAVDPGSSTLLAGSTTTLTSTLRDAQSNVLSGRTVTWTSSNPAVATVNQSGSVTAIAAGGPITIAATSEGITGTAQVTVLAPVTAVTITGSLNTKVGDSYTYTATLRVADGSVVTRPVSWSVSDPARASITAAGILTPLQRGAITLRVTVDGTVWSGAVTAYDWTVFGSGTSFGVFLQSDTRITNKFGTSDTPTFAIGCSSGTLLAFVDTERFVTQNGLVTYAFDAGPFITQFWLEFDSFSALGFPGPASATRTFATRITQARTFGFAFTEFNGGAKAMIFRVTGAGTHINPWITQCPASLSSVASDGVSGRVGLPAGSVDRTVTGADLGVLLAASGRGTNASAESALRAEYRAARAALAPRLQPAGHDVTTQRAQRQPR